MNNAALFISILVGVFLLLFIIGIAALIYQNKWKNTRFKRENPDDWLLYRFGDKVYGAIYGNKYPEDVATRMGIDIDEYVRNCKILDIEPNIKGLIIDYLYGFIFLGFNIIFGILFHPLFYVSGISILYMFMMKKRSAVKGKATEKRNMVARDFPRFLSLLSAELDVGLPIDTAIAIISRKFDSVISEEFLMSLNDVNLGVAAWHETLYKIAEKYELDMLSDFVMDVTAAFNKGVSIVEIVKMRVKDTKDKRLYQVKERAAKAENEILIPIALFQFIPMLVFILVPTLMSVKIL